MRLKAHGAGGSLTLVALSFTFFLGHYPFVAEHDPAVGESPNLK